MEGRLFWPLKQAGSHDDVVGPPRLILRSDQIPFALRVLLNRCDAHAEADGEVKALHVLLEGPHNFIARHVTVRLIAPILCAGQPEGPVGSHEGERVPAVIAPGVPGLRGLLKNEMLAASLSQVVTCGKPGLTSTNDNGPYVFIHIRSPEFAPFVLRN